MDVYSLYEKYGRLWRCMNYVTVGVENLVEQLQYMVGPSVFAIDGRVEIFDC